MRVFKWQGRKALAEYQESCAERGMSPRQVREATRKALPACEYMNPIPKEEKAKVIFLEGDFAGMTPRQAKREKARLIKVLAA